MVDLVAEHPGAEILEIELDWDQPRDPVGPGDGEGRRPGRHRSPGRLDPRWLIVVASLVFAGWMLGGGSADGPAPDAARPAPAADVATAPAAADPSLDLAAAIEGLTREDLVTAILEVQVDPDEVDKYALLRPVDKVPGDFRFAYMGADGAPIVIDSATGDLHSVPSTRPATGDRGLAVLSVADGALGFGPGEPTAVERLATDVTVVRRHTGGLVAVVETAAGVEYGAFVPGQANPRTVLPSTVELEIVAGVGGFVTPQTGGVLEVTPDGLERITPYELVATNGTRVVEFRRAADGNTYWVVDPDGRQWELDDDLLDFGRGPRVSPDGVWMFLPRGLEGDDFPAMYELETGTIRDYEQRVDDLEPVWAPDSSFVAMLDPRRDCIYLFFTSGNNGCISLGRLQIPALAGSAVVVYDGGAVADP